MLLTPALRAITILSPDTGSRPSAEKKHPRCRLPLIGPEVNVFRPAASATQRLFGESWFSAALGTGAVEQASPRGNFSFDIEFLSSEREHNHAFLAPLGVDYRVGSVPTQAMQPSFYFGTGANVVLTNVRALSRDIPPGIRVASGVSIFAGLTMGKRGYLEARCRAISAVRGIGFSGTSFSGGFRF